MTLPSRRHALEALLLGLAWGLCTPGSATVAVPLVLLTAVRAPAWTSGTVAGACCGALWGLGWFGVALAWFPAAWQGFTSTDPTLASLALWGVMAAPVALAGLVAGRLGPWGWAVGMTLHEALAPLLPLPAATSLVLAESAFLLAPAALWRPLLPLAVFGLGAALHQRSRRMAAGLTTAWLLAALCWPLALPRPVSTTTVALVQPDVGVLEGRTGSTRQDRAQAVLALLGDVEADWLALPEDGWPLDPGDGVGTKRRALLEAWAGRPPALLGTTARTRGALANRLVVVEQEAVTAYFDKQWLVPAFEREWLGLGQDTYQPGSGPRLLHIAGLRVGPLICYEDLWASGARTARAQGAQLLVAATNDGWLGPQGARQHLGFARLAAVSSGLWVVRPTLSGTSAAIDPFGRLTAATAWVDGDAPEHDGQVLIAQVPVAP